MKTRLKDHFKIYPGWDDIEKDLLEMMSFCFVIDSRLYFKMNTLVWDPICDCYELVFDTDNGMYIAEGAMRFNSFMGDRISDSGTDVVAFISSYLQQKNLYNLILNETVERETKNAGTGKAV